MARDNSSKVQVVHNGKDLGIITWVQAKVRAVKHKAVLKSIDETKAIPVFHILGGTPEPSYD